MAKVDEPAGGPDAPASVAIGPPRWARFYVAAFFIAWCVIAVVFFGSADAFGIAAPAVLIAVAGVLIWRLLVSGIRTDRDLLIITFPFSRMTLRRADVVDVYTGRSARSPAAVGGSLPGAPAVVIATRDGRVLSGPPLASLPFGRLAQRQVDQQVDQIRRWAGLPPA